MNYYSVPPSNPDGIFPASGSATDTSDVTLLAAPGAGLAWMVTSIVVYNAHATTNTGVRMKSTSLTWGPIPAPATGGCIPPLPKPLPFPENEAVKFAALNSVTTVYVSILAYKAPAKLT